MSLAEPTPRELATISQSARTAALAVWKDTLRRMRTQSNTAQAVRMSVQITRAALDELYADPARKEWVLACLTELETLANAVLELPHAPADPPPSERSVGHTQEPWRPGH
jgi:hypothetical protein